MTLLLSALGQRDLPLPIVYPKTPIDRFFYWRLAQTITSLWKILFDLLRMREAVRMALEVAEHPDFKGIIEERTDPLDADLASDQALDKWIMREVTTGQHIADTCRMEPPSDPMAVVDQFGWVHGLQGLRVADASIMPDCVRANLNATTIMIGERIAGFMLAGQ